ncbi:5-formyltetrahydrofolate cyclo-ligase [soil metagenome]
MTDNKQELRERVLQRRQDITDDDRSLWNMIIFERAHKLRPFQMARRVHLYRSFGTEVESNHFFDYAWGIGKEVYVPVMRQGTAELAHVRVDRDTKWHRGAFGVEEPVVESEMLVESTDERWNAECAIVVPVVGFDLHCHRLGYGKGFYDRFLATTTAVSIGLAFECQKLQHVAAEDHDVPLTCVVTEQRTYVPL